MKSSLSFIRIFVGAFFVFSGLLKMIDPVGFSFKLDEYFSPSVFNIVFLSEYSLWMSYVLVVLEFILGMFLILGEYKKLVLSFLLLLMVFFTFLTFYSAYFDKVTDCGCFGDAIKLTPWQSFYKDLILLALVFILIKTSRFIRPVLPEMIKKPILFIVFFWAFFIPARNIISLPIIDFRSYKEGVNLNIEIKKEGVPDEFKILYQLENSENGEKLEISDKTYINEEKYWAENSKWEIIDTKRNLIKRGVPPPIKDFDIDCLDDGIKTNYYLNQPYLVLFTSYGDKYFSPEGLKKIKDITQQINQMDLEVLLVSSNKIESLNHIKQCSMDATTLKTINRSNPGVTLLHKGVILKKYHWRQLPKAQKLANIFLGKEIKDEN